MAQSAQVAAAATQAEPIAAPKPTGPPPNLWRWAFSLTGLLGSQSASLGNLFTGPAGIYWQPAMTKSGAYTVSATFNQMEATAHAEAYGLFIGGSDLTGAGQKYTYFLVRQDGKFMIKRRQGANTPTIADWTDSAAVKKTEGKTQGSDTLAIAVTAGARMIQ